MNRILLWLFVFGLSVWSIAFNDLRALGIALAISFGFVGWEWIKEQRRKR